MGLASGQRLGPYEIVAPIGAGGMGEVYRARDPRLGRDVAVKVLPEHFADDLDSLQRFEIEAKAVAALSHPNILSIFDTGRERERVYVVTELLEGETLRARLKQGPLGPRKAAEYAARAAEGLAAAHEKGIVHRDVKPENIFLTTDGRVKILDFGLARQDPLLEGEGDLSQSPTAAAPTSPGAMIGTVGYLAPEQARGEPADRRADVFSLGAVLFEMLTGRRAFQGRSPAELLSSILRDEPPPPSETDPRVPKALDLIVRHCLEKKPDERFQSARDLAFHLDSLDASASQRGVVLAPAPPRRRWLLPAALGLAGLALAASAFVAGRRSGGEAGEGTLVPVSFQQLTDAPGEEREARLGPKGTNFVFVSEASGNADIYLQRVGGRNPIDLTPDSPADDTAPALSPDGERIVFRSTRDGGGLFVMGSTGESVKRLTTEGYDPAFSPDGTQVVYSTEDGQNPWSREGQGRLRIVLASGGEPRDLATDGDAVQPSWSPDGRRIAYWGLGAGSGQRDIRTVAADGSGPAAAVTDDPALDWNPVWSPDGRSLYFASERGGAMNVWRVAIDLRTGGARGRPEPLTVPSRVAGSLSLSADGRLMLYVSAEKRSIIQRLGLDPATGRVREAARPALQASRVIYTQDLSPDGQWIAFTNQGVKEDLYVVRADGTGYRQLTDDSFRDRGPRWSPDGSRIGFYSDRSGRYEAWAIRPDGSGLEQLTRTEGSARWLPEWSPDGKRLATTDGRDTWITDLSKPLAERRGEALPHREGHALYPRSWSPDGTAIAGDYEFYVLPTSVTGLFDLATRQYRELPEGRGTPEWMSDGRRLVVAQRERLVVLDTRTGRATPLVEARPNGPSLSRDDRWLTWIEHHDDADVWLARFER
jgi:eukaryotic-like serine/threonine-protein kinase